MMRSVELQSPAKINLFLDIIKRRNDGYHDIVTVFEKIDLCDRIRLSESGRGIELTSNVKELPLGKDNLIYKACSLLKESYGISNGVKIHIEKNIPISAGMGGGSSNAAVTLKGLNELWKLGIKDEELYNIGKKLGADVPFFIFNYQFALGKGRGDEISRIETDLKMWHVILTPPARVLTGEIYGNSNLNLTEIRPDVKILLRAVKSRRFEEIKKNLHNALERIVSKKVTDISKAKNFVKNNGFDAVCVTGSGPTIFVLTNTRKEAEGLKDKFLKSFNQGGWKVFVVKTYTAGRRKLCVQSGKKGVISNGYNRSKNFSARERRP
ncbi:MAG: 4-(cytidine 5'-diphospho)-2-C-methyl-D-erythritol kinase [Candidatus Omnitrophota bacterium]|nr:4-(cytidine 5'-diphospho)-2-C-methyl-D-erythritol kinase [Candidatus Omnitrophota bacterium]